MELGSHSCSVEGSALRTQWGLWVGLEEWGENEARMKSILASNHTPIPSWHYCIIISYAPTRSWHSIGVHQQVLDRCQCLLFITCPHRVLITTDICTCSLQFNTLLRHTLYITHNYQQRARWPVWAYCRVCMHKHCVTHYGVSLQ